MQELIERLEKETGTNADLGREVLLACGWRKTCIGRFMGELWHWSSPDARVSFNDDDFYRHNPTRSLDTAMLLVPEGGVVRLQTMHEGVVGGHAWISASTSPFLSFHDINEASISPVTNRRALPLALCIAAVKARARVLAKEC